MDNETVRERAEKWLSTLTGRQRDLPEVIALRNAVASRLAAESEVQVCLDVASEAAREQVRQRVARRAWSAEEAAAYVRSVPVPTIPRERWLFVGTRGGAVPIAVDRHTAKKTVGVGSLGPDEIDERDRWNAYLRGAARVATVGELPQHGLWFLEAGPAPGTGTLRRANPHDLFELALGDRGEWLNLTDLSPLTRQR